MTVPGRPPVPKLPVRTGVTRTVRKIALCGSHDSSLVDTPWDDPSWEFWGHSSSRAWYKRHMDRYFDLHPPAVWSRSGKKVPRVAYLRWLAQNTVPIYMQQKYEQVPASVQYPRGRILMEFSYAHRRQYFTNHAAWMIALAITEGVSHIGFFGINYSTESEYVRQRGSAEYWIGQCDARGINVVLPEQCSLLAEPKLLYGYESHDEETGELKDAYKRREWKPAETIRPIKPGDQLVELPPEIKKLVAEEERESPRPEWSLGPLPVETTPHLQAVG